MAIADRRHQRRHQPELRLEPVVLLRFPANQILGNLAGRCSLNCSANCSANGWGSCWGSCSANCSANCWGSYSANCWGNWYASLSFVSSSSIYYPETRPLCEIKFETWIIILLIRTIIDLILQTDSVTVRHQKYTFKYLLLLIVIVT
jgi:hypothetical protein